MRQNLPVTNGEYVVPDGATLMSTTDPKSIITYANAAFLEASGFPRDELLGKPHNEVRHPDMPPAAFADLWRTVKAGDSWTGIVKNRRKNGDYYWVRANVAPVFRGGVHTGYISVRTKPTEAEIADATKLYAQMNEGRSGNWQLTKGLLVRTGWMRWLSSHVTMTVGMRVRGAFALLAAACLALGVLELMSLIALFSMLAVTALGWLWLERQIVAPLQLVHQRAQEAARGRLHSDVRLNRSDEIGMVLRAINQCALNLAAVVADVGEQASGVGSASKEIAEGNMDLSSRTEQTASSLQQTAASMEQLNAAVASNTEASREAVRVSQEASDIASHGGALVTQVAAAMDGITESSKRISDIIAVIDSIAFQTNILALNAAVEAARAGEQGRGFAVVAAEVRALAQRSAEAAKEIKSLIGSSVESVEAGSAVVREAGQTMERIVEQVNRVSQLIAGISSASVEQSSGISQVGAAVSHLDQMTQQNAALVEQAAAASESLRDRAAGLVEAVAVFR